MANNTADKFPIYCESLKTIFEKIKKNISKYNQYYGDLISFTKDYLNKIHSDKGSELNADKYFIYFKMALEDEDITIVEIILENMQKLIMEDLLLGKSDDVPLPNENNKEKKKNYHYPSDQVKGFQFKLKRKMIDSMVDSIVKLTNMKDENVKLNCIKLLHTLYKNPKIQIHNDSLLKMFKICIRIYLTSKATGIVETTKTCLNHMLMYLFTKMEQSQAVLSARQSNRKSNVVFDLEDSFSCNRLSTSKTSICTDNSSMHGIKDYTNFGNVYTNPINDMLCRIVTGIVDDICLFNEKHNQDSTTDFPLNSVPYSHEQLLSDLKYRKLANTMDVNEKGFTSGCFGWCFMCRNTAHFYCKDSRKPICSFQCKEKLEKEEERIVKYLNGELISEDDIAFLYFCDCINLFKSLCQLINTSLSSSNEAFNSKAKLLSLELILTLLEKPGNTMLNHNAFIKIVKDDLTEGLVKNCISEDTYVFGMSLNVFDKIWQHFREYLKQQISVFIETFFLKILDSGNSSYSHKWSVLDHFFKQTSTPRYFVELYANYDCDINEQFLVNRIITSLSKIAQGKYARSDLALTTQQEHNLRLRALETLTQLIQSILLFTSDQLVGTFNKLISGDGHIHEETEVGTIGTNEESIYEDQLSAYENEQVNKEKIDINLKTKNEIQTACEKFNIKIKSGINYLKKVGLVRKDNKDQEAQDIACFIKNNSGLKKEFIGELLGENNEIALKVLKYYTDSFDFRQMHIIESIRRFLASFQLPGESQKIDRIMEKFAAKYYSDNQGLYETADCAYYLAFAIIILQTDTHNPQVKRKLGYEGFVKLLKGQNGGKDLDPIYLNDIYQQILVKPITLVEYEEKKDKLETNKRKHELFKRETERMLIEGTEKLKAGKEKQYHKLCELEYIIPMMDTTWTALLAMFSLILEESDDTILYGPCIEGMANSIKLLGLLNLDYQKDAMIKGFCKVTNIFQGKEIRVKHIECIKSILNLSRNDGGYIRGSWKIVLELISKIEYYHMIISGSKAELEQYFKDIKQKKKEKDFLIEKNNLSRIVKEISPDDYEIIFTKSITLDTDSIVDFVKSLCDISRDELANNTRIFSLQKLVEVTEMNMNRVRLVWSKIWSIISEYLTEVGSNPAPEIAEKAVDSLRQLAKKFLQKEESSEYHFQKEFLKPFENILINNINVFRTKEYVITCITNLVLAEATNIKSGWRIIFNIFQLAAEDASSEIIQKTFDAIVNVFRNNFIQVKDNFPELTYCIKKFAVTFPEEVIQMLSNSVKDLDEQSNVYAVISTISAIMTDQRENIRLLACTSLFESVKTICANGSELYIVDLMRHVFKVILIPVIDDLITLKFSSTVETIMVQMSALFEKYSHSTVFLLKEFFEIIESICVHENEAIAQAGIESLKHMLGRQAFYDNTKFWELILTTIGDLFKKTLQHEFLNLDIHNFTNPLYNQSYQDIVYKNIVYCIVQHNIIKLSDFIFENHIEKVTTDQIFHILQCMKDSYELAYNFNIQFNLRKLISSHFMSDLNQAAALFKQQKDGCEVYFKILRQIIDSSSFNLEVKEKCRRNILADGYSIFSKFCERVAVPCETAQESLGENERLINNMIPTVIDVILPILLQIEFYNDAEFGEKFVKCFIEMITCNDIEVRLKIREVLLMLFQKLKFK